MRRRRVIVGTGLLAAAVFMVSLSDWKVIGVLPLGIAVGLIVYAYYAIRRRQALASPLEWESGRARRAREAGIAATLVPLALIVGMWVLPPLLKSISYMFYFGVGAFLCGFSGTYILSQVVFGPLDDYFGSDDGEAGR